MLWAECVLLTATSVTSPGVRLTRSAVVAICSCTWSRRWPTSAWCCAFEFIPATELNANYNNGAGGRQTVYSRRMRYGRGTQRYDTSMIDRTAGWPLISELH